MTSRLFWKAWAWLWLVMLLIYIVSGVISSQLKLLDDEMAIRDRPWRAAEALALEAERYSDEGGDLKVWVQLPSTNQFGPVYLLDHNGLEISGKELPDIFGDSVLRPFDRQNTSDSPIAERFESTIEGMRGFARTVFIAGDKEPLTLVYVPSQSVPLWQELIPTTLILFLVGMVLTAFGAWMFSRYLVGPIAALFVASEKMAVGDFTGRPGKTFGDRNDELAQLARHFDLLCERLGIAIDSQKTLLRDVSHELMSPLARMQIVSELLSQNVSEKGFQDADSLVERLDKEVVELQKLLHEILSMARFDNNFDQIDTVPLDLVVLLQKVVEDSQFMAQPISKEVGYVGELADAEYKGDEKLLCRAVDNIVRNAIQYAPENTRILVSLSQDVSSSNDKRKDRGNWRIEVTDNGPGIALDDIDNIFRLFYRAQAGRSSDHPGHGVGLAMAARIIAVHNGSISAKNHPQGGLVVRIDLPINTTLG